MQTVSPEQITAIRKQYADGVPIPAILARNKVSRAILYYWVDGGPDGAPQRLPPLPRRASARPSNATANATAKAARARKAGRSHSRSRKLLVGRLWRAAGRQVRDIERRLAGDAQEPAERERDARMLAVLVKTLRELDALDQADNAPATTADIPDDDPVPRDIDEFRRELARRIEAFVTDKSDSGLPDGDR